MTNYNPLPKHKMAILTFFGLLVPVYFIPKTLSRVFQDQALLSTIIAVAAIVVLMSYIIMPILTWLFRGWIEVDFRLNEHDQNDVIEQKTDVNCQEIMKSSEYQVKH